MTFERVVVLGAGIAGVAAAAALRPVCGEVVMVERDALPTAPRSRRGVPQGKQLHQLLARAQMHLESLLPGFCARLQAAGAGTIRVADETHVFELGVHMPERDLGLRLISAPRPVIEHVAREILLEGGRMSIREGVRAVGLRASSGGEVTGVEVDTGGVLETIPARLVVDATGSASLAPQWLEALGLEKPPVHTANVAQWYVSMVYRRPPRWLSANDAWLVFPTPPKTRGALVSPIGTDHWYVSMSGRSGDRPPADAGEMLAYAKGLEDPTVAGLLAGARPAGAPNLFRKGTATWRRYDHMEMPLSGFLPIGDAVASLNPLFGQGMSVASWQAAGLAELLRDRAAANSLSELTARFLSGAAESCRAAWELGDLVDRAAGVAEVEGVVGAAQRQAFVQLIRDDAEIHRLYVRTWHLLEPASRLLERAAPGARLTP